MSTDDPVRRALHSVFGVRFTERSSRPFPSVHRRTPNPISIRLYGLLITCAFGLLSCSTGRSLIPTAPTPTVGSHHFVRPGETLAAIGRLYGVAWQTLAKANQLVDPNHIEVGQAVWIPPHQGTGGNGVPALATPSRFVPDRRLPWPTDGVLSSGFGLRGGRLHSGIDISGVRGTPIVAVDAGTVTFSGRGPGGYGMVVMLDHGNGLMTLYAHNERNLVRQGQRVRRGQTVALMGDSGRASGTHVHFEVHRYGKLVDPLGWLR